MRTLRLGRTFDVVFVHDAVVVPDDGGRSPRGDRDGRRPRPAGRRRDPHARRDDGDLQAAHGSRRARRGRRPQPPLPRVDPPCGRRVDVRRRLPHRRARPERRRAGRPRPTYAGRVPARDVGAARRRRRSHACTARSGRSGAATAGSVSARAAADRRRLRQRSGACHNRSICGAAILGRSIPRVSCCSASSWRARRVSPTARRSARFRGLDLPRWGRVTSACRSATPRCSAILIRRDGRGTGTGVRRLPPQPYCVPGGLLAGQYRGAARRGRAGDRRSLHRDGTHRPRTSEAHDADLVEWMGTLWTECTVWRNLQHITHEYEAVQPVEVTS